ncbi:MAG: hypothetical protein ACRDJE_27400 [Dehalococcoidia bacterium]
MFTNATLLEFYAHARRDEDLRVRRQQPSGAPWISLRGLLRRLAPRPTPVPVPIRVQPRQGTR